jgi:hypothetical protein
MDQNHLFVAPHTPNPWGHVELVQKTWVLGSGYWVGLRSAKCRGVMLCCHHLGTQNLLYIYYITLILLVMKNLLGYIGTFRKKKKLSDYLTLSNTMRDK